MRHAITRRDFMKHAAVFSAIGVAPQFLTRTVGAATRSIGGFKDDRVLVVVQLGGGNDGLNTLVPSGADASHRPRPPLGLREDRLPATTTPDTCPMVALVATASTTEIAVSVPSPALNKETVELASGTICFPSLITSSVIVLAKSLTILWTNSLAAIFSSTVHLLRHRSQ